MVMVKDSNKDLRITLSVRIEDINECIGYLNEEVKKTSLIIDKDSKQNTQQKEQGYKKENIIQYVEEALLYDKIDFKNENIYHTSFVEEEALKNLGSRRREYVKSIATYRTYYIMCEDGCCFEAYEKEYCYGPNDHTCYILENESGEELCSFYDFESYSKILAQPLSVIEINGNKALCLRANSFYPYDYMSYRMRLKIGFAFNRLIKRNPNLVSDIMADILSSQLSQNQTKLLLENNQIIREN